jgi:hypothetical protein
LSPSSQAGNNTDVSPRLALATATLALTAAALVGCPKTEFIDEGRGQPGDRASGVAPPGSTGACRVPNTKRPPIVNAQLWGNLRNCSSKTPRRYLRLGYGRAFGGDDEQAELRMKALLETLAKAPAEKDGNIAMLTTLRTVRRQALEDEKLSARVERASGRTFACDYSYLLNTTQKQYAKVEGDPCPAYVYDPKLRTDVCLFDLDTRDALWLTSAWGCLAFTETLGEGHSCFRMCAYDDYCASQVNCAEPDFDLAMCAMGVCLPEKVAGIY